ncbi:hypothetical protein BY996DRAFT_6416424 [Phakopsora pachyrhizi]|nr:hypothetical protein BY996DRAFT_6416424 [Phakopsora pachyrhizi]
MVQMMILSMMKSLIVIPSIQSTSLVHQPQRWLGTATLSSSSPLYLNPTIWILAFLCQCAQGFTIPRICDLSKFVRKATSIMLTMTPMIHLPTFKTSSDDAPLQYGLGGDG